MDTVIPVDIIEADLNNEKHASDLLQLTDMYAQDAMGMEEPLPNATRVRLIDELKGFPTFFCLLAYHKEKSVGIANCFVGFSTFEAQKIINIHDLAVRPEVRGLGIGEKLLTAIQKKAEQLDCGKLTLEVREDNPAKELYGRFGFENEKPRMWFMTKELF